MQKNIIYIEIYYATPSIIDNSHIYIHTATQLQWKMTSIPLNDCRASSSIRTVCNNKCSYTTTASIYVTAGEQQCEAVK